VRFFVESWAPEYGTPAEDTLVASTTEVEVHHEIAADRWAPVSPDAATAAPECIVFVDGVRRVDARVWIDGAADGLRQGVCATYAAGAVRCNGKAEVVGSRVERGVFCCADGVEPITTKHATWAAHPASGEAPEQLWLAVQEQMGVLEAKAAIDAGAGADAQLVVVDGPLLDRRAVDGVVGYVKTHHVHYLDPGHEEVVAALRPGQRTPLFRLGGRFPRWSWYLRLPHGRGHPWAGVVRCEAPPDLALDAARRRADQTAAALPRFASEPHKDPRAPQNLHPIAGLERALRRRLGDPQLLERALRVAATR
jgi:hypothetical protein